MLANSTARIFSNIKEPSIYGTFESSEHYLATLDLLLASTDETKNRYDFFIEHVLPTVSKHAAIDVGLGDGQLTGLISKAFHEMTLVDISDQAIECAAQYVNQRSVKLDKIIGSIVDAHLPVNQFNLAVLSHTLYYIDADLWLDVTRKMLSSLKENGLLVIVLNGGLDKDHIVDLFGGQRLKLDDFINDCRQQLNAKTIDVSYSTEYFRTKTLSDMLHIVGLHLYDVGATATKNQLTDYLMTKKDDMTRLYQFLVYQKFILIRK